MPLGLAEVLDHAALDSPEPRAAGVVGERDPVEVLGGQRVPPTARVRVVLDQEERRLGPVLLGQVAAQDLGGVSDTPRTLRAQVARISEGPARADPGSETAVAREAHRENRNLSTPVRQCRRAIRD